MHTRASNSELVEPLLEPERTLNRRCHRRNRRVPFDQRNNPPKNPRIVYPPILDINHFRQFLVTLENLYPMDDEPMWAANQVVAPTPGSAITILETANEFAIKGNHLTLVKGNQFDGRTKTDPHKHIHEFLRIYDMFKYRDFENEVVRLMMFPVSLTGEARTWLDELNEGTIETWDELRTAFISHFFPLALFDRLLEEIQAFSQHENESLTDAWLRMKEMLRNCHGHNLSKGNIIKIFYHGLIEITQEVLNATAYGIFLYKTPNQAYQLLEYKVLLKLDWAKTKKTKPSLKKSLLSPMKELTNAFVKETLASIQNLETKFDRLTDKQSGRHSGSLPSNTQPNPKGHESKAYQPPQSRKEHVNVVFTRSGKSYNPPVNSNDQQTNSKNPINFDDSDEEDEEPTSQSKIQNPKPVKETTLPKPYKPKIMYPQRLRKEKMEDQYGKFLDVIRAVRINVPLIDVLAGMPNYGKFLKELISNKHKIKQISVAFLSDESSAMIQNKVPPKLGDPGIKQKQLNLIVGIKRMIFNIDSAMKHSYSNDDTCFSIDVIDEILEEDFDALLNKGSKILHSIEGTLLEEEIFAEFDEFMAMTADENSDSESDTEDPPFEKITINTDYKIKTSLEEPPTDLELKPLPDNLEYVFLEEPSFLPIIISSQLSKEKKNKLISVLKKHKQAFAWKTTDIPGICPSFCKHKIQLLDDKKPVVQKQRRLNPNMQEVVKKEIMKLLDTGIIYPIADSPWVSPIHCVPKKGGITVVTNENDELVPTRTITGWRVCIDYRKLNEATAKDHFYYHLCDSHGLSWIIGVVSAIEASRNRTNGIPFETNDARRSG
ncbi:reverse transcriptase domain-containing protein [Tanacetum coccineum]